jgi:hypothetical protein
MPMDDWIAKSPRVQPLLSQPGEGLDDGPELEGPPEPPARGPWVRATLSLLSHAPLWNTSRAAAPGDRATQHSVAFVLRSRPLELQRTPH